MTTTWTNKQELQSEALAKHMNELFRSTNPEDYSLHGIYATEDSDCYLCHDQALEFRLGIQSIERQRYGRLRAHNSKVSRFHPKQKKLYRYTPTPELEQDDDIYELMALNADACIVFWDGKSRGTQHMINIAKEKNIPLRIIRS